MPQTNPTLRIISNIKGESFASFNPAYITLSYKLPPAQVTMTNDWFKGINIDPLECEKKMIMLGKQLRQNESGVLSLKLNLDYGIQA